MKSKSDRWQLLKLLDEALKTADVLELRLIALHIDHARALLVEKIAKDQPVAPLASSADK